MYRRQKPIDVKYLQANQNNRNNENGTENNAFDRLLNIIQVLEENNQILFRSEPIKNNPQKDANEHVLRELQDIFFSFSTNYDFFI